MIKYKIFYKNMECTDDNIDLNNLNYIYPNIDKRDIRVITLGFEGDIAQFILKEDGMILKLHPITCIYTFYPEKLILLNIDNDEVNNYCNHLINSEYKINTLTVNQMIENLLLFHSFILDKKICEYSNKMKQFMLDTIKTDELFDISILFHNLLNLKNQYQEIQQTLLQIMETSDDSLLILNIDTNEFKKIINIYQNQFEEDVKNLIRMGKEIEVFIQISEIKFAEMRNKIAINSLKLDLIILFTSTISMFGSIFGANIRNELEDINYGLYLVFLPLLLFTFIFVKIISECIFNFNY